MNNLIAHPLFMDAFAKLSQELSLAHNVSQLLYLVGPPGSGKTFMGKFLHHQMKSAQEPSDQQNISSVLTDLQAHERGFSWNDFYRSILKSVDPFPPKAHNYKWPKIHYFGQTSNHLTTANLREALLSSVRHRNIKVVILDEGQHFLRVGGGKRLIDQADILKSLSDQLGIPIVIIGTYLLNSLTSLNGQLARRSRIIYLERYRDDKKEDILAFAKAVNHVPKKLPFADDIHQKVYYILHEKSVGCVGTMIDIVSKADRFAYITSASCITEKHIVEVAGTRSQISRLQGEIAEGEAAIKKQSFSSDQMWLPLDYKEQEKPKNNPQPGKPNPKRYPTGDSHAD